MSLHALIAVLVAAREIAEAEGLVEDAERIGLHLRDLAPEPEPEPEPQPQPGQKEPLRAEDVRDAVKRMSTFTLSELAHELGYSRATVKQHLDVLLGRGIARDTGLQKKHGGPGRPAAVYEYAPLPSVKAKRERRVPPEVEARQSAPSKRGSGPSGRKRKVGNTEMRELITAAREAGWGMEPSGGHYWLLPPAGSAEQKIRIPSTPSDHRAAKNARAMMRRAGIPV